MDKTKFIECFAEAMELDTPEILTPNTEFRTLNEWDSLSYLSIIAMLDEEYAIQIENAEFKQLRTIGDIIAYIEENQ